MNVLGQLPASLHLQKHDEYCIIILTAQRSMNRPVILEP